MADDLSLLFRLRADNAQAKAVVADTRAAVAQLRQSFGPELTQTVTVANKAFSQISDNLNVFVGQRIPLVGGAFVRVTENLRNFSSESGKSEKAITAVAKSIQSIATESNKTVPQITSFLTKFVQIEGQANRDKSAIDFFGASLGAKLIPQLEETGAALGEVAGESAAVGTSIGAMAGPIGIAVVAIAALAAGAVVATREIFDLAKTAADFQGKLFDLSQQTGVSVETLSALEVVARTTGSSIEALVQSLGIFQKKLEEAVEDPGSKAAVTFRNLGVDARDTETALRQTVAALAKMPEGFHQTALALEVFGRGGKAFLAIAKESNGDIDQIIERLRNLGLVSTEQAKLADEFNDQLVLLDVQLRGLGAQAIPVVLDVLKDLSKFLAENRILFIELQGAVKGLALAIAGPVKLGFVAFKAQLEAVAFVTERIKAAIEFIIGHPIPNPFAGNAQAGNSVVEEAKKQAAAALLATDQFRQQLKDQIESREKLQAVLNVDFAKQQAEARDAIAKSQRDLEAGKIDRAKALEQTIAANKKEIQSQIDALEVDRRIKLEKAALAKDDLQKQQEFSNQVLAIDAQLVEKRSTLARTEADLRAKARLDDQKAELAHRQSQTDNTVKLGELRIAKIEDLLKREKVDRDLALKEIEDIENKSIQARGQLLRAELSIAGIGPDRQAVLDKIKAIETERTALERQQSERRVQIARAEFEQKRQILLSSLDALLQIEQVRGNAQIASIQAQAALRVKTEEEAAKEILAIRLRLIDSEIEATKARQDAAKGISDPQERRQTQAQLANDLKLLNAEREAIQEAGNRDIDEKRKEDLTNERRYADDLEEIKRRTGEIERDAADEVIRLMVLHFARRKDIIRAQRDLDLADEAARHQRVTASIRAQQQEVDTQIRILEAHLKSLKIGTTEEIEQHERLIEELEKLRIKRAELKAQQDAEEKRTTGKGQGITEDAQRAIELLGGVGGFLQGLNTGQLAQLENGVQSFADVAKVAFSAVGVAASGLANAVGEVVKSFVLLGSAGGGFRKIAAEVIASIAQQATVSALFEGAQGLAMLALTYFTGNPKYAASAAAHFAAAAAYGLVAGGAIPIGRRVAGGLFKTQDTSGESGSSSPQPLQTITQGRNQQQQSPQVVRHEYVLRVVADEGKFGQALDTHFESGFRNGGKLRELILNDGGT